MKIIPLEAPTEPYRAPDLGWDGVSGDLILNALTHADAPGDFRAEQGLATQVLILLMTDARVEDSELPDGEENRGWIGDSFDREAGEDALGSRLWLLTRQSIFDGIEVTVEDYVREALQPLIDQGAVVDLDVSVTADRAARRVDYTVSLYGKRGERVFARKFQLLWDQINGVANPIAV